MLFGKLLPREGNFFEMFNQHADRIVEAAHAFAALVQHYNDPILRDKYNQDVDNAERAADRVTHEVNRAIHKTFITPIDREQIHSLINTMDDVATSSMVLMSEWICSRSIGVMKVLWMARLTSCVTRSAARSALSTSWLYLSRRMGSL